MNQFNQGNPVNILIMVRQGEWHTVRDEARKVIT